MSSLSPKRRPPATLSVMVKQERNFHCAVCGKTYADPAAAQDHARKHISGGRRALAAVAPQPTGTAGVQQTTPPITTAGNIGTAHPPSSSQRAPPNPLVGSTPKRPKTSREKLSCPWCPHLKKFRTTANLKWHRKTFHATIYKVRNRHSAKVEERPHPSLYSVRRVQLSLVKIRCGNT